MTATNPIAPNTRCPVSSIAIMVANMKMAIISYDIGNVLTAQTQDIFGQFR